MRVCVVGLGHAGLPLAGAVFSAGHEVCGVDVDPVVRGELNCGVSGGVGLGGLGGGGVWVFGPEVGVPAGVEVVLICVPTPLDSAGRPDLGPLVAAVRGVGVGLREGMLVVVVSSCAPGTTGGLVRGLLEEGSGLVAGVGFGLGFSAERVDPGNGVWGSGNTPRVVGGLSGDCVARVGDFFGGVSSGGVRLAGSLEEAELAKLLENTFRHVNLALVNELSRFCWPLGVDLWNVVDLASSKPFGFEAFWPGPGPGGHCVPVDPHYLSDWVGAGLGADFRMVEAAEAVNAGQPVFVGGRVLALLVAAGVPVRGARVLLLGVSYKANVADVRGSPAGPLASHLAGWGVRVAFHDPGVSVFDVGGGVGVGCVADLGVALADADVVVLLQAHDEYVTDGRVAGARRVLDCRGVLPLGGGVERL